MSDFVVASTAFSTQDEVYGQSFKPNVPGPNGSGSPGAAKKVMINDIIIGFSEADVRDGDYLYIYDHIPLISQLQTGQYAIATSDTYVDGQEFGTGSYTRKFTFTGAWGLDPNTTYYFLFPVVVWPNCNNPQSYSGGTAYSDLLMPLTNSDLQFKILLETQ